MRLKLKIILPVIGITFVVLFGSMSLLQTVKAPAITLKTIDGRQLNLTDFRGRPLLINFWATTCVICVREMPDLIALYEELHPQGFELISIAMAYDPPNRVVEMAELKQIPYPLALDLDSSAATAFGDVQLTPNMFLISPQGDIAEHYIGSVDINKLRERIQGYL